tara:strand:+ start:3852 stop:4508 length:657 start_codon:yes stop_codon:yes gene_type:complete
MTARTVLKWPDAKLLKPSEDVRSFDSSLEDLAEDLYHTMVTSFGAGIAAPQIGVHKNVCVISSSYVPSLKTESFRGIEECVVLVNPVLEACDQKKFVWEEGCLSVPNIHARVERGQRVRLNYANLSGELISVELSDIESATVQHETDHLLGKLFIHRLKGVARMMVMKKLRKSILSKKKTKKIKSDSVSEGKISQEKRQALRKKRKSRKKTTKSKKRK